MWLASLYEIKNSWCQLYGKKAHRATDSFSIIFSAKYFAILIISVIPTTQWGPNKLVGFFGGGWKLTHLPRGFFFGRGAGSASSPRNQQPTHRITHSYHPNFEFKLTLAHSHPLFRRQFFGASSPFEFGGGEGIGLLPECLAPSTWSPTYNPPPTNSWTPKSVELPRVG